MMLHDHKNDLTAPTFHTSTDECWCAEARAEMPQCVTLKCDNKEMTETEREKQFIAGYVGVTMYEHICSTCFDLLKEEI